jgi:hypothetical protein
LFALAVSILIIVGFLTANITVADQEKQNRQAETVYVDVTSCNSQTIGSDENLLATSNEKSLVVLQFIGSGITSFAERGRAAPENLVSFQYTSIGRLWTLASIGRAAPGDNLAIVRNNSINTM